MKYITILLFCSVPFAFYAQVGQVAAKIVVEVGKATLQETAALVSVNLSQKEILKDAKDITKKSAIILALKEAELLDMKKTPGKLKSSGQWKFTLSAIDQIIFLANETNQLIQSDPKIYDFPPGAIASMLLEATNVYAYIGEILKEDEQHLMKSTDRYALLVKANRKLAEILEVLTVLNDYIKSLGLFQDVDIEPTYDLNTLIDNTKKDIKDLIK